MASQNDSTTSGKKIAVIGAGPAGIAAALRLQSAGFQVDLWEAGPEVGGLCRTLDLWGHKVDLGPHRFFSADPQVYRLWQSAVGEEFDWVERKTRIFYQKKYFNYPLQVTNTFFNLGLRESVLCLVSYMRQWLLPVAQKGDFESWIVRRFGRRLYNLFFKTYTEKLWGLPCAQIDAEFAYRKIRKLHFLEVFKNIFYKKKTFVEYFAYPRHGTGQVYETLAQRFVLKGGALLLKQPVTQLQLRDGQWQINAGAQQQSYSQVIATLPVTLLVEQLGAPEEVKKTAQKLHFRNTILVYLLVEQEELFPDNWIYVHTPQVRFGRITNFRNWSPSLFAKAQGTVLCLEYWCNSSEEIWQQSEESLIALAQQELTQSELAPGATVVKGHVVRLPRSYPVFELGYKKHLQFIKNYLKSLPGLHTIGRNGSFKYNNQDHSILMGLRLAESIIRNQSVDVEQINSDFKYEEDVELSDVQYDQFDEV